MSTFATLPAKERELFFRQYQERRGVDPVIAEKDFWVCWLLGRIFEQPQLADACVFKGGTSLSKVFGAIKRFSEDIDLAIIPASLGWKESDLDQAPSRTKREERMAGLEAACAAAVQATWQPRLEESVRTVLGAPAGRPGWLTYLCVQITKQCSKCFWASACHSKRCSLFCRRLRPISIALEGATVEGGAETRLGVTIRRPQPRWPFQVATISGNLCYRFSSGATPLARFTLRPKNLIRIANDAINAAVLTGFMARIPAKSPGRSADCRSSWRSSL